MPILYLILGILSSGFTGNIYKKLSGESNNPAQSAVFPGIWYALLGIFFTVLTAVRKGSSEIEILPAVIAGIGVFTAAFSLIEAMKQGSFSLAVIIINLNFIIPVVLSAVFLHEDVMAVQLIGMLSSVIVIILLNLKSKKNSDNSGKTGLLLSVAACVSNGIVNFMIKLNEKSGGSGSRFFALMYFTAVVCAVVFVIFYVLINKKSAVYPLKPLKKVSPYILLMGLCNGVCFSMTQLLAGFMNAAAQFTIITSASVFLSLSVGIIFQKEKPSLKIILSFLLCLAAIFCQAVSL